MVIKLRWLLQIYRNFQDLKFPDELTPIRAPGLDEPFGRRLISSGNLIPGRGMKKSLILSSDNFTTYIVMPSFSGKIVWITGASSGIGEALVALLAKEQATLILSSRREDELRRVQKTCGLTDECCLILPFDLEQLGNPSKLVEIVLARYGQIDVLINNGGISQRAYAKDTDIGTDRRLMEVNYFGPVALTKSVLPGMISRKSGQIVVISSVAGKFGFFLRSAYSASKHALQGFFESLRMELFADNIQVLLVCPGKIATHISVNALTADGKRSGRMDDAQANGMTAETCARRILEAMKQQKEEIIIGNSREQTAVWLKRFFPHFFSKMIRKQKAE